MTNAATTAASSGVNLDRKLIKTLGKRGDRPGLIWFVQWIGLLAVTGTLLHGSLGTWWVVPAMIAHGGVLTVPAYALSHETAHGTAFRTRWLNEAMLWLGSLIYLEEPHYRRYSHTRHHTYTWHVGRDSQMPFDTPMTFGGWLLELFGPTFYWYEIKVFAENASGRFSESTRDFTPEGELWKLKWGARACLLAYAAIAGLIVAGQSWLLIYLVIPRLVGQPVMQMFTILQHVELQENDPSILKSTRSFRAGWLGRFLYMNMNNHVEHHLYPLVPFHALPALSDAVAEQVPPPDPGLFWSNADVFIVTLRRSLGLSTKASVIRQAPHMVSDGGFRQISKASMG